MANPFADLMRNASNAFTTEMQTFWGSCCNAFAGKTETEAKFKTLTDRIQRVESDKSAAGNKIAEHQNINDTRHSDLLIRIAKLEAANSSLRNDLERLVADTRWLNRGAA